MQDKILGKRLIILSFLSLLNLAESVENPILNKKISQAYLLLRYRIFCVTIQIARCSFYVMPNSKIVHLPKITPCKKARAFFTKATPRNMGHLTFTDVNLDGLPTKDIVVFYPRKELSLVELKHEIGTRQFKLCEHSTYYLMGIMISYPESQMPTALDGIDILAIQDEPVIFCGAEPRHLCAIRYQVGKREVRLTRIPVPYGHISPSTAVLAEPISNP